MNQQKSGCYKAYAAQNIDRIYFVDIIIDAENYKSKAENKQQASDNDVDTCDKGTFFHANLHKVCFLSDE